MDKLLELDRKINLKVGQEIKVSVKELDKENKRIKLVYDKKGPDPWSKVAEKYNVEMPIVDSAYDVLFNGLTPAEACKKLMTRELKFENED